MKARIEHHVAARDRILGDAVAGKVERAALARDAASAGWFWAWIERTRAASPDGLTVTVIAHGDRAGQRRSRHHRADPAQGEATIDREPESGLACRALSISRAAANRRARRSSMPLSRDGRGFHDGGRWQPRAGASNVAMSALDHGASSTAAPIGFGQRDQPPVDAKQIDDGEMLDGLRHDTVIGRDREQHEIDSRRAGQHVVEEMLDAPAHRQSR